MVYGGFLGGLWRFSRVFMDFSRVLWRFSKVFMEVF